MEIHLNARPALQAHLSRGFGAFPDAEIADGPGCQEAQGELPAQVPNVLDPSRNCQHPSPGRDKKERKKLKYWAKTALHVKYWDENWVKYEKKDDHVEEKQLYMWKKLR